MIRRMSVLGIALTAGLFAQSANASASDSVLVSRVPVPYGDLNLATVDGQAALQARVAAAANRACGSQPSFHARFDSAPSFVRADFERCRAAAQQNAVSNLSAKGIRLAGGR